MFEIGLLNNFIGTYKPPNDGLQLRRVISIHTELE
jgi:hypothetical protein